MRILGIDPGAVSAAWALIDTARVSETDCADVPVVDRMVDAVAFNKLVDDLDVDLAVVELVSSMPKQGVASTFRFGFGCGIIRGVLQARSLPIHLVTPTKWKREMGLDSDGEKSRALAIRLYPVAIPRLNLKKHHGRAEALLLAEWYRRQHYEI